MKHEMKYLSYKPYHQGNEVSQLVIFSYDNVVVAKLSRFFQCESILIISSPKLNETILIVTICQEEVQTME